MDELIAVLPPRIATWVRAQKLDDAIEIVMDLGSTPELRWTDGCLLMIGYEITQRDVDHVVNNRSVTDFYADNRAGVNNTLHRISAMRDTKGNIYGLTLRVGKALYGCATIIKDLIDSGESILLLGAPGLGKTSKLRDAARHLANESGKRVVIVDTSNEIAGHCIKPHPSVGRSRRMMVPLKKQAEIMIEAVKNHTPDVVVIDEISTNDEAKSARTISERGVQLLGTAHGTTIDNLIENDPLTPLIGRIKVNTISDDEMRRRGLLTKNVTERESSATFTKIVELIDFSTLAIHHDTDKAVDAILRGDTVIPEVRAVDIATGEVTVIQEGRIVSAAPIVSETTAKEPAPVKPTIESRTITKSRTQVVHKKSRM